MRKRQKNRGTPRAVPIYSMVLTPLLHFPHEKTRSLNGIRTGDTLVNSRRFFLELRRRQAAEGERGRKAVLRLTEDLADRLSPRSPSVASGSAAYPSSGRQRAFALTCYAVHSLRWRQVGMLSILRDLVTVRRATG